MKFVNFYLEGKKVTSLEEGDFRKTDHSSNVTFE